METTDQVALRGRHIVMEEFYGLGTVDVTHFDNEGGQIGQSYLFNRWPKKLTEISHESRMTNLTWGIKQALDDADKLTGMTPDWGG